MLKNYFISLGYFFAIFFLATFLITIFNYFNLLNDTSIFRLLIPVVSIFISGFFMGHHSRQKGYLEGLKIGITVILIFIIFVLLFDQISINSFIFYTIILLSCILGSMLGINWKKN